MPLPKREERKPVIFSYVMTSDKGFAPNPYHGVLTLACCKPDIRKRAIAGDWLIGTTGVGLDADDRVVYAARIHRVLSRVEYWKRYPDKQSSANNPAGDNIYAFNDEGEFLGQCENPNHQRGYTDIDLGKEQYGRRLAHWVLLCKEFFYFGRGGPKVPDRFVRFIIATNSKGEHKRRWPAVIVDASFIERVIAWVKAEAARKGINSRRIGEPYKPYK